MIATSHVWLLNTWAVISETKQQDFKFYLIVIKLNLNYDSWLPVEQHGSVLCVCVCACACVHVS